jgi:hypothetical protein
MKPFGSPRAWINRHLHAAIARIEAPAADKVNLKMTFGRKDFPRSIRRLCPTVH